MYDNQIGYAQLSKSSKNEPQCLSPRSCISIKILTSVHVKCFHAVVTYACDSRQRVALAEEALDALCQAVDPCLMVQPVASLAQYGNARLKVYTVGNPWVGVGVGVGGRPPSRSTFSRTETREDNGKKCTDTRDGKRV